MFWLSQIQQRKFKHQKVKAGSWMMLNVSNTFKRRMLIPLHSLEGMIYALACFCNADSCNIHYTDDEM